MWPGRSNARVTAVRPWDRPGGRERSLNGELSSRKDCDGEGEKNVYVPEVPPYLGLC